MTKLEHDLSHFMIREMCKDDPSKRGSPEMFKYKGLNLIVDQKSKEQEKTVMVRIGALEAEFKIDSCEKNSGGLSPEEEYIIKLWLNRSENSYFLKSLFVGQQKKSVKTIVPFDLEHYYAGS